MENAIITVEHLVKQFGKHKAVDDVSLQIRKGSICGLIGPNGAGKTTLMKMLGGLVMPDSGKITIFGKESENDLAHERSRMSFIIETPYAKQGMSAKENLTKQCYQKGIPDLSRVDEVLSIVGLGDTGKKSVKNFSLGMRQRLGIAGALLSRPEVMVLDEPVNGLDPEGIVEVRDLITKLNHDQDITVIISSHILAELSHLCTDYIFINNGQIKQCIEAEQLRAMCQENYHIHTDNDPLAVAVLQEKLGIKDISVDKDGSLRIHERLDEKRLISETLYQNGLVPLILEITEADLEQYYMELVGENNVEHRKISELHDKT